MLAGGSARTVTCGSCGAVLDLTGRHVLSRGYVQVQHHPPEGLVEVGRRGRLGEREIAVVGRLRMGGLRGSSFETYDDWIVVSVDGHWLRLREEQGKYSLLVPLLQLTPPPLEYVERAGSEELVDLGGVRALVEQVRSVRTLHIQGEHDERVAPTEDRVRVELRGPSGSITVMYGGDGPLAFGVQPIEDRAMWSIFGYLEILQAHDTLFRAQERAQRVSAAVAGVGIVLLSCAFIGVLIALVLFSSAQTVREGWARFDFRPDDGVSMQSVELPALSKGLGFYELTGECGLDSASKSLTLAFEGALDGEPLDDPIPLVTCQQEGRYASVATFNKDFSVGRSARGRIVAIHEGRPGDGGRAHVSWRLSWRLGALGWPLYGLSFLLCFGLVALAVWPFVRNLGVAPLEEAFEARRAELLLALRRREYTASGAPPRTQGGGQ